MRKGTYKMETVFIVVAVLSVIGFVWLSVAVAKHDRQEKERYQDWECPYCLNENEFDLENCSHCGAPESH
jgi:hypothetical protein